MCGIAGIIDRHLPNGRHIQRVSAMISAIRHRGPDGEGIIELKNGVTFGHVRLAIRDLSSNGAQPLTSTSGRSTIVYNGEIYNFKELRDKLSRQGFNFKTQTDTEVLLNAYEYWGIDFIHHLNGMFAFALYDLTDGSVLFGRDRLGIKPLYYFNNENQIVFGSEIKAVRVGMGTNTGLDIEALAEYLAFQNNYSERTLVDGVKLFPAGSIAKITVQRTQVIPKRFWEPRIIPDELSRNQRVERLEAILLESVADQLQADVPVSSFLSGGIDSCAVASAATLKVGRIKTFTCGFDMTQVTQTESLFDERARAKLMSNCIGSEHYEIELKEDDFLTGMSKWAWHAEEPRVGTSFPNFCVSQLASKFTKICLSGTGADELFGGYPWRYNTALTSTSSAEFIKDYGKFWRRMISEDTYKELIAPIAGQISFDPDAAFQDQMTKNLHRADNSKYKMADAALLFELETFLHGLLIIEDKASMAHGLEIRVPLIDNRMIDVALSIPFNEKVQITENIHNHQVYGRGSAVMPVFDNGKKILRNVLNRYVPPEISGGRKQGFSPPIETWFRREMKLWLTNEVFGNQSPLANFLDMRVANKLWNGHVNNQTNHRLFIWGMVALYLFLKEFLRS